MYTTTAAMHSSDTITARGRDPGSGDTRGFAEATGRSGRNRKRTGSYHATPDASDRIAALNPLYSRRRDARMSRKMIRKARNRVSARRPGPFGALVFVRVLVFVLPLLAACRSPATPASVASAAPPATADAARLARLADDYWRTQLDADPIEATMLGIHGYDDRMPDESPAARARLRAGLLALRARLAAEVSDAALSGPDEVTRQLLADTIDGDLATFDCHLDDWVVDPRDGPQVAYLDLAGLQSVKTPDEARALVARWRAMPATLDQRGANLLRGLAAGKTSARSEVARVARQLDELLAKPDNDWPLVAPAARVPAGAASWSDAARAAFDADLRRAVADGIRPAFARYRAIIRDQILPRARGDALVGILNIPGGEACYAALVRVHTSLALEPKAVHQLGLDELARIHGEMQRLGPAAVGASDFAEIQRRLRGKDPAFFFTTREEIEANARAALGRASAAMPRFLGRLPRTPCDVKRIEPHEEKDAPIAYYRQPAIDGSRPGSYYVNTYDPRSRPRFESESLAFHEAVPGHHVQIALAQEMTGVPEFRKHLGVTAFVEGWGLYAERLADELGLYSSPLTRMGRLNLEAWRAGRLVVDTGIHALGWSRDQAVKFLTDNTAVAANNVENEVDRYIGWPGQALAYKIGELEILRLRAEAQRRLGGAFDLRRFHDVVLGSGAVTLPVLRAQLDRWITAGGGPR
jgi:uncharacterized protein (DUF885 family)